jgi:hypothetical protein
LELSVEISFKNLIAIRDSFKTLIFADVGPAGLDGRDRAFVDSVHVALGQIVEHKTVKLAAVYSFWLNAVNYFAA